MYFNSSEFGKRMQEARRNAGLTQEQLAERLGIGRNHIANLERGATACSIDLLLELSESLKVTTDYLLKGMDLELVKEKLLAAAVELQNLLEFL